MTLNEFVQSTWGSARAPMLLAGVFLSVVAYYGAIVVYNIYFHPLSKYPGLKISAATHLWYGTVLARRTAPIDMSNLHKKYGPVIRVAPDELSFSSPAAWKEIYGHKKPGHPELTKDKKYHKFLAEPIIINADREYHSTLRRLLSNGFSDGALRAQEPILQEHLALLIARLHEHGREGTVALNALYWFNSFTFDVIGYLTYGQSFDCLKTSHLHPFVATALTLINYGLLTQVTQRLPSILQLPYTKWNMTKKMKTEMGAMKNFSEAKVNFRLENPPEVPDFMGKLVEAFHQGKMSFNQLVGNSDIILLAGSETTATSLSGLTFLLMKNPRVLDKLNREIRQEFSSADQITAIGVNKCRYLLACIEECLRLYPPSPATHPRYTPPGGMTIDGNFVPGDMAVGVTILAACISDENFTDADKFVPERWTGEDPKYSADKKEAVQPFSYGPRNCAGRNLAYLEMKLIMASILWHFDLENCETGNWLDQKICMVWEKPPLMVKFKPVKRG